MRNLNFKLCCFFYKMFQLRSKKKLKYKNLFLKFRSQAQYFIKTRKIQLCFQHKRFFLLQTLIEANLLFKHPQNLCPLKSTLENFTIEQSVKFFRMKKSTFESLVEQLKPNLKCFMDMPCEKLTAVTLFALSSGRNISFIGQMFSIKKSDVLIIVEIVCSAIKCLMPQYLKIPSLNENMKEFEYKWGFPHCAGVLGSIHMPLHESSLPENSLDYINSNNEYSMLLQGIVDASYKFWDINVGWPGSVPESRVFTNSTIWLKGQDQILFPDTMKIVCGVSVPIYVLAGTSYPLSHWILRPFLNEPLSTSEKIFNDKLTYAYNACEIAFKRLKARWNCLVRGNIQNIEILPSVIAACCILHNICELHEESIQDDWIVKAEKYFRQPIPSPCNAVIGPQAECIRLAIKESFLCFPSLS